MLNSSNQTNIFLNIFYEFIYKPWAEFYQKKIIPSLWLKTNLTLVFNAEAVTEAD